jgi:hypothetical protein
VVQIHRFPLDALAINVYEYDLANQATQQQSIGKGGAYLAGANNDHFVGPRYTSL